MREFKSLVELAVGVLRLPRLEQREREIIVRFGITGPEADGLLERALRRGKVTRLKQHQAEVIVCLGKFVCWISSL